MSQLVHVDLLTLLYKAYYKQGEKWQLMPRTNHYMVDGPGGLTACFSSSVAKFKATISQTLQLFSAKFKGQLFHLCIYTVSETSNKE